MIKGFYTAKASLIQRQKQTNVISNNIANVNTKNFKRDKSTFGQILSNEINKNYPDLNESDYLIGSGAKIDSVKTDFTPGDLVQSDNKLDLAISGDGFFRLVDDNRNQYLTRGGSFNFTEENYREKSIVNEKGYFLADYRGRKIELPNEVSDFTIRENGQFEYEYDGDKETINIGLVDYLDKESLEKIDSNIYSQGLEEIEFNGQVRQGFLEMSNIDLATELVSLMTNQRMFTMNSKVIQTVDEMSNLANHLQK
jgi:flagellar basal-body rod protein FlgG